MSEISETEIKSMTKEQNYMRGYADGKLDTINAIREQVRTLFSEYGDGSGWEESRNITLNEVIRLIDRYKAESEE